MRQISPALKKECSLEILAGGGGGRERWRAEPMTTVRGGCLLSCVTALHDGEQECVRAVFTQLQGGLSHGAVEANFFLWSRDPPLCVPREPLGGWMLASSYSHVLIPLLVFIERAALRYRCGSLRRQGVGVFRRQCDAALVTGGWVEARVECIA